jgi:hypothetical protein
MPEICSLWIASNKILKDASPSVHTPVIKFTSSVSKYEKNQRELNQNILYSWEVSKDLDAEQRDLSIHLTDVRINKMMWQLVEFSKILSDIKYMNKVEIYLLNEHFNMFVFTE